MNIQRKVSLAFASCIAIVLATALLAWSYQSSLSATITTFTQTRAPTARAIAVMIEAKTDVARAYAAGSNLRLPLSSRLEVQGEARKAFQRFDEAFVRFEALPHTEAGWRAWREGAPAMKRWREAAERVIALQSDRDALLSSGIGPGDARVKEADRLALDATVAARGANKEADPHLRELDGLIQTVIEKDAAAAADAGRRGQTVLWVAMLLGTATSCLLGVALLRSLAAAIRALIATSEELTRAIEEGELDVRGDPSAVSAEFRGVIAGSNRTMESMARRFHLITEFMDRLSRGDLPPHDQTEARGEFTTTRDAMNRCVDAVAALVADAKTLADAAVAGDLHCRADAARHHGEFAAIVTGFNATLDAVLKPIGEATDVLESLARRDLRARVRGSYRGDHAKIAEALNATADALHDAMAQVAQAAGQVSSASAQIASSSQAVASGASQQASALEETSSSLESMTSTTRHATDNAQQANSLAQRANAAAAGGSAAVTQMTAAMGKIKASAAGTSQIIKDINEIAFQTNLLALNAAVEAARAGDAGRGFAVVAEEVRSLALRSKEAASKTEDLIRESVREAGEGEATARRVQDTLGEIAASVTKVSDIVREIAAAAKEQATGIDEVARAVGQMSQVTQQNAASSEESSSAAAELSGQSEELAAMVATFQLDATSRTSPRRAA